MVGCRTKGVRSKMSDIVLVEVMSLAEVRLQEGESIENALRQVQTQGSDGRHHQGSEASLVLPEAGREAPGEAGLGEKACPKKAAQRRGLTLIIASSGGSGQRPLRSFSVTGEVNVKT